MRAEPFDRCDNCGAPANRGDERAWYIARFQTTEPTDHRLHIRGVLCGDCSHGLGHGMEASDAVDFDIRLDSSTAEELRDAAKAAGSTPEGYARTLLRFGLSLENPDEIDAMLEEDVGP